MSHASQIAFLTVVEEGARSTLLTDLAAQLTAGCFSDGTWIPHGLVQLTLLTHQVFQTPKPDQIRDIRLSRVVPCRERPRLLDATVEALLWYDTCLQSISSLPDRLHQRMVAGLHALKQAIEVYQHRPGHGPRVDVQRKSWQTLADMVATMSPEDYRRFGNRKKLWDRTINEAKRDCACAIVTAFRQHGPEKGYADEAIYHATAAIMTTLAPTHPIKAGAIQKALTRQHRPALELDGQPLSLANLRIILDQSRSNPS